MNLKELAIRVWDWLKVHRAQVAKWGMAAVCLVFIVVVALNIFLRSHPNNHNEAVYGKVRVSVDASLRDPTDRWSADQMRVIRRALGEAQRLGPTVQLVEGETDVTIYKADLDCVEQGVARFFPNTRIIEIDPRCTTSDLELQAAVLHELGHYLGMSHVCTAKGQAGSCSPVGTGDSIMNPGLVTVDENDQGPGFDEVWTGPYPQWEITELDVKEFVRSWALIHPR